MVDLCVCNSWLLARRDAKLLGQTYKMLLKKFSLRIATSLLVAKRVTKRKRSAEAVPVCEKIRKISVMRPQDDVRYDATANGPIHCDKGRCKNCKSSFSRM